MRRLLIGLLAALLAVTPAMAKSDDDIDPFTHEEVQEWCGIPFELDERWTPYTIIEESAEMNTYMYAANVSDADNLHMLMVSIAVHEHDETDKYDYMLNITSNTMRSEETTLLLDRNIPMISKSSKGHLLYYCEDDHFIQYFSLNFPEYCFEFMYFYPENILDENPDIVTNDFSKPSSSIEAYLMIKGK